MFFKLSKKSDGRMTPDTVPEVDYYERRDAAGFTRTGDTTFTVTNNSTNQAIFKPIFPICYKDSTDLYGIIKSYSSGTVTVRGPALPATINSFKVGPQYKVYEHYFIIIHATLSEDGDDRLLAINKTRYYWGKPPAYMVWANAFLNTGTSGGGVCHVSLARNTASTDYLTSDIDISAASTSVFESTTNISTTNYLTNNNEKIFINTFQNIGSDGHDLTVQMFWVFP